MFKWDKLGKVFDPTTVNDRPWLKEFAQAPSTLIFDDYVRVYFSCRPPADANGQYASYSAFVDLDRKDLTKVIKVAEQPILPLGGLGEFDEFGTYPVSVCRHQDKVIAYYAGWTRCESVPFNTAIGMASSRDNGVSFEKVGTGPIIPYSPFEPFVMSGPKIRYFNNQWYLFYIAGSKWILDDNKPEPVYKIRSATSSDGKNWIKTNISLVPDVINDDEAQALLNENPSYVFFNLRENADEGPRGSLNVPLVAERSIAVDRKRISLGSAVWVDTRYPDESPLQKLVFAQDTGGAIRGELRGDFFFGNGEQAEYHAGRMKQDSAFYLLKPKHME